MAFIFRVKLGKRRDRHQRENTLLYGRMPAAHKILNTAKPSRPTFLRVCPFVPAGREKKTFDSPRVCADDESTSRHIREPTNQTPPTHFRTIQANPIIKASIHIKSSNNKNRIKSSIEQVLGGMN